MHLFELLNMNLRILYCKEHYFRIIFPDFFIQIELFLNFLLLNKRCMLSVCLSVNLYIWTFEISLTAEPLCFSVSVNLLKVPRRFYCLTANVWKFEISIDSKSNWCFLHHFRDLRWRWFISFGRCNECAFTPLYTLLGACFTFFFPKFTHGPQEKDLWLSIGHICLENQLCIYTHFSFRAQPITD